MTRRLVTGFTPIILALILVLQPVSLAANVSQTPTALVDPRIPDEGVVEVLVALDPIPPGALKGAIGIEDKIRTLQYWASKTQAPVIHAIESIGGEVVKSFWITNAILVRIDASRVLDLASIDGVRAVVLNTDDVRLLDSTSPSRVEPKQAIIENWGVNAVNATGAWSLGYMGNGVRILVIDTGVYIDHVTLQGKLLTLDPTDPTYPGGWIRITDDGLLSCTFPSDTNGHGTFVASLALGGAPNTYRIGVAPAATLMAVQAFQGSTATPTQVLTAFEWAADPRLCNGTPTGIRPHIVSFSAGFTVYAETFLLDAIRNLLELNIIVVAAIGNDGPGTTAYPGNIWGVYGIGAIDNESNIANFSSGGQVVWSNIPANWPFKPPYPSSYLKPDFVAPGVNVIGAGLSANAFTVGNGTSYATPHISGLVALVLEAMGALNHSSPVPGRVLADVVYDVLVNASVDLGSPGLDDRYGYGLPDAGKAVTIAEEIVKVYEVNVTLSRDRAKVGDTVTITIPEPQDFTIPNGTLFTIYMNTTPLATAEWNRGLQANITIPETPRGVYEITAADQTGRYIGSALLTVEPSIEAPQRTLQGYSVTVTLYAHDPQTLYTILLDGVPVTNVTTNDLGTARTSIQVPEDVALGEHVIESRDASTGETLALATITVATSLAPDTLFLQASGPQLVDVDSEVSVFLASYTMGGLVDVDLQVTLYTPTGVENPVPIRVEQGVYRVAYTPHSEGYYVLVARAMLQLQDITLNSTAIHVTYASTTSQNILEALTGINTTLDSIAGNVEHLVILGEQANRSLSSIKSLTETIISQLALLEEVSHGIYTSVNETKAIAQDTLAHIDTVNTSLTLKLQAVENAITEARTEISNTTRQTLQEVQDTADKLAGIEEDTRHIRGMVEQLGQAISELTDTITSIKDSLGSLNAAMQDLNATLVTLQAGVEEMQEKLDGLAGRIAGVEQALAGLADQIGEVLGEIRSLGEKLESLADTVKEQAGDIAEIREAQASIQQDASSAKASAEEAASKAGQATLLAALAAVAGLIAAGIALTRRG